MDRVWLVRSNHKEADSTERNQSASFQAELGVHSPQNKSLAAKNRIWVN